MVFKAKILDHMQFVRTMTRITHEIIEKNHGAQEVCLIGIKRRGVPLADMLAENILQFEGISVPVGYVDISLYRDDLTEMTTMPTSTDNVIPCDISNYVVIIVDDVIFTGRTARAAMEAVLSYGRPKAIQLAVLVDRGHREMPIRPDYVGKNIPTSSSEQVRVLVPEIDGELGVNLYSI
ncbi:MAG TPA: bifunctional pyr operon transcriptional regulator/uracil phosphoribosyltransferase PyrR [Lachnospiraceae bacterium]|nr:bifunctional pyr operon transcriptional regulator/uracil phosphoribosyltransferase PyrR [Lachnospiraceae bacterium]